VHQPHSNDSDQAVIQQVLTGQRDRFAILVERYQAPLMRAGKSRLGRNDWAEDVVQETFLWAFKCLKSYDSQYSFRTWLWTILWNQCNRHYQKRARQPQVNLASDGVESRELRCAIERSTDLEAPPHKLLAKERSERLDASLGQLPDALANALRLRFFAGLKFHEIADVMECSLSTAKHRVRNGLLKLSQSISENEFAWDVSTGDAK